LLTCASASTLRAAAWTNLAPGATLTSNDSGISGSVFDLQDQEVDGGRYHQSINFETTNARIAFVRAAAEDVSFVRFYNGTDPVGGAFGYKLQYLTGANPALDADWTDIPGSARSFVNNPRSYFQTFDPVNTRGIRWYLTEDNNAGGTGNIRYSEFEYYGLDQNKIDWMQRVTEVKHSSGAIITSTVTDNDMLTRYVGPSNGPQNVRMLWAQPFVAEHIRFLAGDTSPTNGIETFTIEYLILGGDPDNNADWLPTGVSVTGNSSPLKAFDLPGIYTRGLRINMSDPSSFSHEVLRLNEIEVFPEPASASVLAVVGAMLLRRRLR
jgi:hypothetical protein